MKKGILFLTLSTAFLFLLSGCVSTHENTGPSVEANATGSLSPVPTRANPWNQVNPGNQAAYQATRGR